MILSDVHTFWGSVWFLLAILYCGLGSWFLPFVLVKTGRDSNTIGLNDKARPIFQPRLAKEFPDVTNQVLKLYQLLTLQ